jgi:E3 ubiquitin-protein ligase DOA10
MHAKDTPRSQSGQEVCRICLSEDVTNTNPLISPCKCAGTMKMIHIDCLREWLNSKCTIKQNGAVKTYCWKAIECELCKEKLPDRVPDPTLPKNNDN